jgi:protein-S-isoprenylcysteine O-methyltransferase Ste14
MNSRALFVTVVPVVAIAYLCLRFPPEHLGLMEVAGLTLTIAGLALLTLARLQLGNSFSMSPQARQLVTTGLYSRLRNPIYVFSAIALAGLALYFDRPILLLGLCVLVPLQVARARAEARVLEQKFGEEYIRYKANTWF